MSNGPLKARLFVGGLKSLFFDMASTLEEVEKTGTMPIDILESLNDVKDAVDLTLSQLNRLTKRTKRCCEHGEDCEKEYDEEEDDEELYCEDCDLSLTDCECREEDVSTPPPPSPRKPLKSEWLKSEKVAVPSPTVAPTLVPRKSKKETKH
jgi:hypothetical protein